MPIFLHRSSQRKLKLWLKLHYNHGNIITLLYLSMFSLRITVSIQLPLKNWLPLLATQQFVVLWQCYQRQHNELLCCRLLCRKIVTYGPLRSSSDNMCAVPRTHNSFGDRRFGAVGPRIWNSLPCGLRTWHQLQTFKALLKTYMFRKATAVCDILYKCLRNIPTYCTNHLAFPCPRQNHRWERILIDR